MKKFYFTSESVTEGHPDKLCDYISDTILDEALKQDKYSRVAVETFASANQITIAGQITTNAKLDIEQIVRNRIKENQKSFSYASCNIAVYCYLCIIYSLNYKSHFLSPIIKSVYY